MFWLFADRPTPRALGDLARIELPRRAGDDVHGARRIDGPQRIVFVFGDADDWGSFGGVVYENLLYISLLAADAPAAAYDELPREHAETIGAHYRQPRTVLDRRLANARVHVIQAHYGRSGQGRRSHTVVLADPLRRLQIAWHCVEEAVSAERAVELVLRMAASFQLTGTPEAVFAERRDQPRRRAAEAARKRQLALARLAGQGFEHLQPGKAQARDGILVEWMDDPEPRVQVARVLGVVTARPGVPAWKRPSAAPATAEGARLPAGLTLWSWQHHEDRWQFRSAAHDYLPFPGIAAVASGGTTDRLQSVWLLTRTLRVAELDDAELTLEPFLRALPAVEQAWRQGRLVTGEIAQAPFPVSGPGRP